MRDNESSGVKGLQCYTSGRIFKTWHIQYTSCNWTEIWSVVFLKEQFVSLYDTTRRLCSHIITDSVHLHPECPDIVGFYGRFTHSVSEVLIRWWCHYRWHQACVTWRLAGPTLAQLVTGLRWILSLSWEQTERGWQSSYSHCETASVTAQQWCSWATGSI